MWGYMNRAKKILITTIPATEIAKEARIEGRSVTYNNVEECFSAANNIAYVNGFTCPNYATEFIKANIPSADILKFPTWKEYEEALENGYDIVGISFWTYTSSEAIKMADLARQYGVRDIWGGGHGINTPNIAKFFDKLFYGYGEFKMNELIEDHSFKKFVHPIMVGEYDFYTEKIKTGYLFSIRGCQMTCEFCSGPAFYNHLVVTPIEEVERVLDVYLEQDIRHVTLVDETFLQNQSHSKKVLEALHNRRMTFSATSRADMFIGNIKELREKGLRSIYVGIESLNDSSLNSIKKGTSSSQNVQLFKELKENNSFAFGTYMIGFEHDTEENVKENIEKLNAINEIFAVEFWLATPFPGTIFFDRLDKQGLIINKNWKEYDAVHMVWQHPHMSVEEIENLQRYAVRNHCHPLNIRKQKILRAWDKFDKTQNQIV